MRSEVFTRASTSPASPGDSSGRVRVWHPASRGWALLCGQKPEASSLNPQEAGCPAFAWPEGGARQWTAAGIWAGGLGGGSPGSYPSTRTWGACCAPRACTGCSLCCISAGLPNLSWSLREEGGNKQGAYIGLELLLVVVFDMLNNSLFFLFFFYSTLHVMLPSIKRTSSMTVSKILKINKSKLVYKLT